MTDEQDAVDVYQVGKLGHPGMVAEMLRGRTAPAAS